MKKRVENYEELGSTYDLDYKLEHLEQEAIRDLESLDKWLYLGADSMDRSFAKIGMTMGNLRSRSYSSSRPGYYLFCAFKFKHSMSIEKIRRVEEDVLLRMDTFHRNSDGSSKRMIHYESRRLSECFHPVVFLDFYRDMHLEIYEHHRDAFVICGYENEYGVSEGEFVDCIFNHRQLKRHDEYRRLIIQY